MAGIHCCYRRLLVLNTSRLTNRNGVLLQLTRKRHHLVFQMSSLQNRVALQKPKLVLNANKLLLYRLASTNVTDLKEPISDLKFKTAEVKNEPDQLKTQSTELNNEKVQLNKEPEIVGSSNAGVIDESSLPPIPTPPSEVPPVDYLAMGLSEPPIQSLGLGSWWPSGIIQQVLEYIHIQLNLPWWESILIITVIIRLFMLPVNVKSMIDSTNMMNHMPEIGKLQQKINDAKLRGDYFSMSLHTQEFQTYIKENKINMFGILRVALFQAPVFISMYSALNGMAKAPVESFKTGGLLWFKDFTEADPNYLLPVILAGTLFAVIETGSEGTPAQLRSHATKWIMRGIPVVVFFFSLKFAACITWYWSVSNAISLIQVVFFKIPVVKKFFKIPEKNFQALQHVKKSQKGLVEGFKEGLENAKLMKIVQERERMNLMAFQKAGKGPVPRTFKNNPLMDNDKKSS